MKSTVEAAYMLQRETTVTRSLTEVFEFFAKAENLGRLTPPWLSFRIETPQPIQMKQGARIAYQLRVRGIPLHWLSEIERWRPPHEFVDVQVRGPYKLWRHIHRFEEIEQGTRIVDVVNYTLPFGPLGRLVHRFQVADDLDKIFDYREHRVQTLFK